MSADSDRLSGIADGKTKVVVVTAGHGFEREPFFAIFDSIGNIDYVEAKQQDDSEIFEDISDWDYDVIVLYNMTQRISPRRRANFVKLLEQGVGLLALHHSIAAFEDWPEYRKIIGGKYYLSARVEDGVKHEASTYKHGVDMTMHVEDRTHPVTQCMSDFAIHDETYKHCVFEPDNHVLLSTEEPTSDNSVCWARHYRKARVCYIQLGHGPSAYTNSNYRRLVSQAISWCAAGKD
jgi:hypothetical protein